MIITIIINDPDEITLSSQCIEVMCETPLVFAEHIVKINVSISNSFFEICRILST